MVYLESQAIVSNYLSINSKALYLKIKDIFDSNFYKSCLLVYSITKMPDLANFNVKHDDQTFKATNPIFIFQYHIKPM